jgi:Na+-driven multidrug efflux pump
MSTYTNDLEVIQARVTFLRILAIAQIFNAIGTVLSPALIGAGDMRFILGVEIGNTCFLYLPLAWFLGVHLDFGITGA